MCRPPLFRGFREFIVLFVVVVDHAAIGQSQVGQKVMRADDAPHRKIRHRRIDMRHQMEPAGTDPGAFNDDIGQIDRNELADLRAAIDTRNEEIRAALQAFIGRMGSVPQSVWGGTAASRFKDVVLRWNAESIRLHQALHGIAETIRCNEVALRDAADSHAAHIGVAAGNL